MLVWVLTKIKQQEKMKGIWIRAERTVIKMYRQQTSSFCCKRIVRISTLKEISMHFLWFVILTELFNKPKDAPIIKTIITKIYNIIASEFRNINSLKPLSFAAATESASLPCSLITFTVSHLLLTTHKHPHILTRPLKYAHIAT